MSLEDTKLLNWLNFIDFLYRWAASNSARWGPNAQIPSVLQVLLSVDLIRLIRLIHRILDIWSSILWLIAFDIIKLTSSMKNRFVMFKLK